MAHIPSPWTWIKVECSGGCGQFTHVPPDDPLAEGWLCGTCEYDQPDFHLKRKTERTGAPIMTTDVEQAPSTENRSKDRAARSAECGCGCGAQVKSNYAQGHDAKHVAALVREVMDGGRSRSSALRSVPSAALKEKLRKALDRAEQKAKDAKAKAKGK